MKRLFQFLIFNFCIVIFSHAQYLGGLKDGIPTPFCNDKSNVEECIKNLVHSSELVFEGTVINNDFIITEDDKYFIKTDYLVHKVFKKDNLYNLEKDTISIYALTRKPDHIDKNGTISVELEDNEYYVGGFSLGTTGVIFTNWDVEGNFYLPKFLLEYYFDYVPEWFLSKEQIASVWINKNNVRKFKSTNEIYFLFEKILDYSYTDRTQKKFKKK